MIASFNSTHRVAHCMCLLLAWTARPADCADLELKALYDSHQWFRLREAVASTSEPSAFYRGAVALAFNDLALAEEQLRLSIQSDPKLAEEARRLLGQVAWARGYWRWGPEASQQTNQAVVKRGNSRSHFDIKKGKIVVPVSINGRSGEYILGTETQTSILRASEAARLGLSLLPTSERIVNGENGIETNDVKVAVADSLTVGTTALHNVAFAILPDSHFRAGEYGIIGLPVILALETVRWKADGTFESGFSSEPGNVGTPNICLDDRWLATEGEFEARKLFLGLDTGSTTTHLYGRFQEEFRDLVHRTGAATTIREVSVEGSKDLAAIAVPDVTLRLAGFDGVLHPALILPEPTPYRLYHGNLGTDFLRQARAVTIDFRKMTFSLQ